jgi:hypothetical protein
MDNKNQPAFPVKETPAEEHISFGLSKREWLAGMALQGLLSNPDYNCPSRPKDIVTTSNTALAALHYADALLKHIENS